LGNAIEKKQAPEEILEIEARLRTRCGCEVDQPTRKRPLPTQRRPRHDDTEDTMTTRASTAVITAEASMPTKVEVALRLSTLSGSDNPLAAGGRLERATPSGGTTTWSIPSGATTISKVGELSTTLPSPVAFVLEAPTGKRLLELDLEIVDYASDWADDRVEIQVTAKGVPALAAPTLGSAPSSYSWRLSGVATTVGSGLELGFDLVQEEVATEFVDVQASTRLAFVDDGSGAQKAVIRVKRFKESVEPTP
jgi:hypothetical protein